MESLPMPVKLLTAIAILFSIVAILPQGPEVQQIKNEKQAISSTITLDEPFKEKNG